MTAKNKEDNKDIKWDVHNELTLFSIMVGHKPVGINKHFQMAWIIEKVTAALNRQVNSDNIWKHLESMYDLGALDDMEINGDFDEVDFSLPNQFASMQSAKEAQAEKKSKKSMKETPKREIAKEPSKKETPKPAKEQVQKSPKLSKQPPTPQPSTESPKVVKAKAPIPKTRDSGKKVEPPKEKREPRELKNLGTPEVKQQSRTKETRSGNKSTKEESPLPTRRSLSTSMQTTSSAKRPTRGSMAGGESKATSPAVSSTSSRSSTPQPTPKRRRI